MQFKKKCQDFTGGYLSYNQKCFLRFQCIPKLYTWLNNLFARQKERERETERERERESGKERERDFNFISFPHPIYSKSFYSDEINLKNHLVKKNLYPFSDH